MYDHTVMELFVSYYLLGRPILTQRTSDNQRLGTSNNTTYVAEHPTLKSTGLRY